MTKPSLTAALMLALAASGAHAAELGEATVRSHIGQQLVADVELVDLTPQDLADLQARLASRDVFQGANVTMNPALAGIGITVVKRDGRRILHLATSVPVQAEVLHLYFELTSGTRESVRGVTLWLTPAPPPPVPTPVPAPQPTRIAAAAAPAAVVPLPEATALPRTQPRPAGAGVQLAPAGKQDMQGKLRAQGKQADAELMDTVERAFAARAGKVAVLEPAAAPNRTARTAPRSVEKAAARPAPEKDADKALPDKATPEKPASEKSITRKPASEKPASEKPTPEKPAQPLVKPIRIVEKKTAPVVAEAASPAPAVQAVARNKPAGPVVDQAMLAKLAGLEAKLKSLQAMVAKNAAVPAASAVPTTPAAPAPMPTAAPAPTPTAAPSSARPAGQTTDSAAVVTAAEAPGRTAAGPITDVHAEHAGAAAVREDEAAKPAAAPQVPKEVAPKKPVAGKPVPPPEPVKEKKMSRPKVLTMIAGAAVGLMLVAGIAVHLLRRRKARQASAQIKVWQSWRKKAIAEAATAEESEEPAAAAS